MSYIDSLQGRQVFVLLSGDIAFEGILTDAGQDILVLYNGRKYYYIPWIHVHRVHLSELSNEKIPQPIEPSIANEIESISYRKVLTNARGIFSEIYVTGNLTFHGYITNVLSDYIVFYTPVFKTMYISFSHLKWLTPYNDNVTPYSIDNVKFPINPSNVPFVRSFESQLKKEEGKLVVFDGGNDPMKIGLLNSVENSVLEISVASGDIVYLRLNHIKSVHLP
ncbi:MULTISPECIES: DUF2642 domain-containing protein [unclassified Bacillus (in: firmicutes)]|uniref:DUF2642 domain-containing protein n=1 Tax=Bacillaceae TaxID=186817 RepID=UPI000BF03651|nr:MULTISPECIES: DUF2642 domain-containing protein [unclassified Bacillus (in: firmicutes)]PEJ46682.1 DUF2642 domain-containing protein [Bacillus sp. AFS002410]PEL07669.1 DUF2642 domain-containing protein [Bacillus sp. AFS017336]QKE72861.1 DUF2642 domain-containing protein [Arthrobacter citreus]